MKKIRKKRNHHETSEQFRFCKFLKEQGIDFIVDLYDKIPYKQRFMYAAMRCNNTLDIFIILANNKYYGLFIELKKSDEIIYKKDGSLRKNEHLENQQKTIDKFNKLGYYACFAIGLNHAMKIFNDYKNNLL